MPDHLDEKEKAIFMKLTDGLQPTALEVCSCFSGPDIGQTPQRGLN